jgi:two-component system LytT family response regulator
MTSRMLFSTPKDELYVAIDKIVWCQADNNWTQMHLQDGTMHQVTETLKKVQNKIPHPDFVRCHKSYLVNMNYVKKVTKHCEKLVLSNDREVPVSQRNRCKVRAFLKGSY